MRLNHSASGSLHRAGRGLSRRADAFRTLRSIDAEAWHWLITPGGLAASGSPGVSRSGFGQTRGKVQVSLVQRSTACGDCEALACREQRHQAREWGRGPWGSTCPACWSMIRKRRRGSTRKSWV